MEQPTSYLEKVRVTLALKEYDLWELVDKVVVPPTNPTTLEARNKEIKAESSWI
jgi:hypothetical protein